MPTRRSERRTPPGTIREIREIRVIVVQPLMLISCATPNAAHQFSIQPDANRARSDR